MGRRTNKEEKEKEREREQNGEEVYSQAMNLLTLSLSLLSSPYVERLGKTVARGGEFGSGGRVHKLFAVDYAANKAKILPQL